LQKFPLFGSPSTKAIYDVRMIDIIDL